jgi:hypothetical protein
VARTIRHENNKPGTNVVIILRDVVKEKVQHKWTDQDALSVRANLKKGPIFLRELARDDLLTNLTVSYVYTASSCYMSPMHQNLNYLNQPTNQSANPLLRQP